MELLKGISRMFLAALLAPTFMITASRINAITFKSFTRALTIKNRKLAKILIAEKTTWGIATSPDKRNKMSILGIVSWIIFVPQIFFYLYDWQVFITTGVAEYCHMEIMYFHIVKWFYLITMSIKASESGKYRKGDIW